MAIRSLLFGESGPPADLDRTPQPAYFADLHLDQIVTDVARGVDDDPAPYFRHPLRDVALVRFRQEVFRDLADPVVLAAAERFTAAMSRSRRRLRLLERFTHAPQRNRRLVEIVLEHADAVTEFAAALDAVELSSAGLCALRDDLGAHLRSAEFETPRDRARELLGRLDAVRYDVLLRGDVVNVAAAHPGADTDFSARIRSTFARFRGGPDPGPYREPPPERGLDEVEWRVLDLVVRLFPELFADLDRFYGAHRDFVGADLIRVVRELDFYLGYLAYLAPLRAAGLPCALPVVSVTDKDFRARETFDLALAYALHRQGDRVVVNDVELTGAERIILVSGPNQGGKTTLSRTFGQLHHLAALGCPVPGREGRIFLPDNIFTHYSREETIDNRTGLLAAELERLHTIMSRATPDSVLVLNEIFSATTTQDARTLSATVLREIADLDALCLWVSFLDELSLLSPKTVSMVSTMVEGSRTERTFRLVRRPADGHAYALAIAERHGLTYQQLTERLRR